MQFAIRLYACLLLFSSTCVFSQEAMGYSITLGNQTSNIGRCAVNLKIAGIGDIDIIANAPDYSVSFNIPANQKKNHLLKVKGVIKFGIPPNNAPACSVNGEIFLNQIILDEWKPIKEKFDGTDSLRCVNFGLTKMNEINDGLASTDKLFIRPSDVISKKIFDLCDQLLAEPLKKNVTCDLIDGKTKSFCDEDYFSTSNPNRKLKLQEAVIARLDGQQVNKGLWETISAQESRAELRRKQDDERLKITKQKEEREAWLKTADGKKFLAEEEAKRKQAELEQEKQEREKQARLERYRNEREAQEKISSQNCKKATGMSVGASERLSEALKVSVGSIKFIRTEYYGNNYCEAIIDTPIGLKKCKAEVIVKDSNVWIHLNYLLNCL